MRGKDWFKEWRLGKQMRCTVQAKHGKTEFAMWMHRESGKVLIEVETMEGDTEVYIPACEANNTATAASMLDAYVDGSLFRLNGNQLGCVSEAIGDLADASIDANNARNEARKAGRLIEAAGNRLGLVLGAARWNNGASVTEALSGAERPEGRTLMEVFAEPSDDDIPQL